MMKQNTIYLDYQASTPVHKNVLEKMQPYFSELYGNPHSSDHIIGWEANKAVEKSLQKIADALNADSDEIIFTSGATESNNMVLKGLEKHLQDINKMTMVTSSIEHKCVLESAEYMEERGFKIIHVKPNPEGIITIDALEEVLTEEVGLVSIMLVNNEIGTIQPIKKMAEIAHNYGALFHTDASQAPVFMSLDVDNLSVDFMSLSSHKAYGPKGIGALYIFRDYIELLQPLIHGGGQQYGLRSGTLPTALCVGMGEAINLCAHKVETNAHKLESFSHAFWYQIKSNIPGVELNGSKILRHPGNLNIVFPGVSSSHFLQCLQPSIAASKGSACNSGIENPSYVLAEIGIDREKADSSIRFSFGIDQTEEEIRKAVETISKVYKQQANDVKKVYISAN
jgi:cysteine desulfurase